VVLEAHLPEVYSKKIKRSHPVELRNVDPKTLKPNPDNPRRAEVGGQADEQLVANIRSVGILQPPVVRDIDNCLVIRYGHRRVRAAIALGLNEITVLVLDADDGRDDLRALSENVVRANLNPVEQWRAIEALSSASWTEDAIGTALALPVRTIKKLKLLALIHPPMLDYIAKGDMPRESDLRTISAASREEQASVWKSRKPKKGQPNVSWYEIANSLAKRRMLALDASFGAEEEKAYGIAWQEDLFAPADEDTRYTTEVDAFLAAQTAWLDAHLPKNGIILETDDYGRPKLPPKAERVWGKPSKGDTIGKYIDPRSGKIEGIHFRIPKKQVTKDKATNDTDDQNEFAPVKNARPEITQKGGAMIGDFRTQALETALLENPIDDSELIALLVLAFSASNVEVRSGDYDKVNKRRDVVSRITDGGRLTKDITLLRSAAREVLTTILSCRTGYHTSGIPALIAGDTIGADTHLPNMATEEFLSCLSKAALEKTAASLGVPPGPRAKDTRAAVIEQAGKGHFVHPNARFAPTEEQLAAFRSRHTPLMIADDESEDSFPPDSTNGDCSAGDDELDAIGSDNEDLDETYDDENRHLDDDPYHFEGIGSVPCLS
jgi:ParB family chromosome partitioning protein